MSGLIVVFREYDRWSMSGQYGGGMKGVDISEYYVEYEEWDISEQYGVNMKSVVYVSSPPGESMKRVI